MIIHDATQKIQETKKLVLCFHGGSENNFDLVYIKNQFSKMMNTNAVGAIIIPNHTKDYIWWHNALVNLLNRALVVQYFAQSIRQNTN